MSITNQRESSQSLPAPAHYQPRGPVLQQEPGKVPFGQDEPPEMNDVLLKTFSKAQKEYIIRNLYPYINKALVHFVSEATRHKQIKESFCQPDPSAKEQNLNQASPAIQSQPVAAPAGQGSAFGGYRVNRSGPGNAALPSNLQNNNSFNKGQGPEKGAAEPENFQPEPSKNSIFGQQPASNPQVGIGASQSSFGGYRMQPVIEEEKKPEKEQEQAEALESRQAAHEQSSVSVQNASLPPNDPSQNASLASSSVYQSQSSKRAAQGPSAPKKKILRKNHVTTPYSAFTNIRMGSAGNPPSLVKKYEKQTVKKDEGPTKFIKNHRANLSSGKGTNVVLASSGQASNGRRPQSSVHKPTISNLNGQVAQSERNSLLMSSMRNHRRQGNTIFSPKTVVASPLNDDPRQIDGARIQTPKQPLTQPSDRASQQNGEFVKRTNSLKGGQSEQLRNSRINQTPASKTSKFQEGVLSQQKKNSSSTVAKHVRVSGVYLGSKSAARNKQVQATPTQAKKAKKFINSASSKAQLKFNQELDAAKDQPESASPSLAEKGQVLENKPAPLIQINSESVVELEQTRKDADSSQQVQAPKPMGSAFGAFKMPGAQQQEEPFPAVQVSHYQGGDQAQPQVNINLNGGANTVAPAGGSSFGNFNFGAAQGGQPSNNPGQPVQQRQYNFGNFGMDKKRNMSLPINAPIRRADGTFGSFAMSDQQQEQFKPVEQFRASLAEVTSGSCNGRILNQASPNKMPNRAYLNSKRSSVFHKAFDSNSDAIVNFVPPVYPKDDMSKQKLVQLFTNSFLTKNIDPKNHQILANAMFARNFSQGQVVIRYGDMGSEYFVLASGAVRVTVYQPGTNPADPQIDQKIAFEKDLVVDSSQNAEMIGFGEIALLYNDKRTASITASSDCQTWVLSGDVFKQIIALNSIRHRNISLEYLQKVELFKNLEQYEKVKLIDGLKVVTVPKNLYVFHQGEKGDNFFIIEEGQVECILEESLPDGRVSTKLIRTLDQGQHFGEVALINNVRRTLSVRSSHQSTRLLSLDRTTFNRILGNIKHFLKGDYSSSGQNKHAVGENAQSVDGSFVSEEPSETEPMNRSVVSQQKLFGIQEQDEFEDPLSSDRALRPEHADQAKGIVQPQRVRR